MNDEMHRREVVEEASPAPDTRAALELVRSNALALLTDLPRLPSVLRVRAGDAVIEAEWPVEAPARDAVAAVPAPAGYGATMPVAASASAGATEQPAAGPANTRHICAPSVGVFYLSPEPGAKPFVELGDTVVANQQVAIVEVMKLMIPVHAEIDGKVVGILRENGDPVEYGESLFAVAPFES